MVPFYFLGKGTIARAYPVKQIADLKETVTRDIRLKRQWYVLSVGKFPGTWAVMISLPMR